MADSSETGYPEIHDPRTLRGIAHPVRSRILGEISAAGHLRAADVAEVLGIPANQASFHLRQLAKYGLIEPAPELARDGRDRVWKPVHEHGFSLQVEEMEKSPGGRSTVAVWRRQAAGAAKQAVDTAYAARRSRESHVMISDEWIRLTRAEAKEFSVELLALQEKWQERVRQGDPVRGSRRTYHLMQILQPAPEVES